MLTFGQFIDDAFVLLPSFTHWRIITRVRLTFQTNCAFVGTSTKFGMGCTVGLPLSEKLVSHKKKSHTVNYYKNIQCLLVSVSTLWAVHAENSAFTLGESLQNTITCI